MRGGTEMEEEMETKKGKKYMSDSHLEDYTEQYEGKQANAGTMIFDGGRRTELLNGEWQYAVDQYDTCLRQKWFLERHYDNKGNTLPVDYSFDEWPVMQLPACWNTLNGKRETVGQILRPLLIVVAPDDVQGCELL